MTRQAKTVRLFVAVYPPSDVAQALHNRIKSLHMPEHRPVPFQRIHLTLQFIGDVDLRQLDATIESVQRSSAGLDSFVLSPSRLIKLPQRGHARLIAAECDEPASMIEIQRRLAHRLARKPRRNAGDRFLPHMTLARFRLPTRLSIGESEATLECDSFVVQSIQLMRSTLQPNGAVHEVVHEVRLYAEH